MSLLKLSNIEFEYLTENTNFKLRDINLEVQSGEFLTIVGPNGSGKSTLLKIIARLLKPVSGKILINSKPIASFSSKQAAKNMAVVPQSFSSIFPYSVYETVMMGRTPYLNLFGYETEEDIKIVLEALELVEISHLKNKGLNEISGGEAQRAFIARALVQQPKILLLDEPNAHLDIKHQIAVFEIIKSLNKERGITVLSISHDLDLAAHYSDRFVMMKNGKILFDDLKEKVLSEENIASIFGTKSKIEKSTDGKIISVRIVPNLV